MKTKPVLTQQDCEKIQAAARAEAVKNKWNVTIAIVDDGGHLLSLLRGDGVAPVTAEIAARKGARRRGGAAPDQDVGRPHRVAPRRW